MWKYQRINKRREEIKSMSGDFLTLQLQMKKPRSAFDDSLTHIEKDTSESSGRHCFLNKRLEVCCRAG